MKIIEQIEKEMFMREALKEAQKAYDKEEVPIGAVVVLNGEIIGRGHNLREMEQDATLHAEIKAIRQANNHQVEVEHGVLEEECQQILKDFFKGLRERNKRRKEQKRLENGE